MSDNGITPHSITLAVNNLAVNRDRLDQMFHEQRELQIKSYGKDPGEITDPEERIQFIKDMSLALTDEMAEFMAEIGWKPWATSRHVNEEAAQGELVDQFHFFMNLCMAVNMTPDMLFTKYMLKRQKNADRQAAGYDGVTTKCARCKRALDDTGVDCETHTADPLDPNRPNGWCGQIDEDGSPYGSFWLDHL